MYCLVYAVCSKAQNRNFWHIWMIKMPAFWSIGLSFCSNDQWPWHNVAHGEHICFNFPIKYSLTKWAKYMGKTKKYKISNICLWLVEDYLKRLKSIFFENFSSFFYGWVIWDRSIGKICKNLYIFSWKQVEFINMNEPRVCCAAVGTINYWENEVGPPHSSWPWNKLFGQL